MCVSELCPFDLGTNLSFIFCKPLVNAPLGNFLGQKIGEREISKYCSDYHRKWKDTRKMRDDWFAGNIQALIRFTVYYSDSFVSRWRGIGNTCLWTRRHKFPSSSSPVSPSPTPPMPYWVSDLALRVKSQVLGGWPPSTAPAPRPTLYHGLWPGFSHHKQQRQQPHPNSTLFLTKLELIPSKQYLNFRSLGPCVCVNDTLLNI